MIVISEITAIQQSGIGLIDVTTPLSQILVSLLTIGLAYFGYHNWTSPRTRLHKEGLSIKHSDKLSSSELQYNKFILQLTNVGTSVAVFRVRVWIDKKPPPLIEKTGKTNSGFGKTFNSCLFAQNPIPSPFGHTVLLDRNQSLKKIESSGPYPKRTKIYSKDFNKFSNYFRSWVDEKYYPIMHLQTDKKGSSHKIRFEVEQTGENYVFEYKSKKME